MRASTTKQIIVIATIISAFTACSKDSDNNSPGTNPPGNNPPKPKVQIATDAQLGKIMTDSAGKTLYFFSNDPDSTSGCSGGCLAAWPIFYEANPTLGDTSLHAADFGTITRADGAKQTTYKGWPLYYYVQDTKAGDVKGEAVGGVWFVAKTDYSVMIVNKQLVGNNDSLYTSKYVAGTEITQYLTDDYGRTLYAFTPDKFKKNNYTKSDFSNNPTWPIYEVTGVKSVPSVLTRTDFDTLHVFGRVQLTYKGWPLYHFGPDNGKRGSNKGISVPKPGIWPIVNKNTAIAPQP